MGPNDKSRFFSGNGFYGFADHAPKNRDFMPAIVGDWIPCRAVFLHEGYFCNGGGRMNDASR